MSYKITTTDLPPPDTGMATLWGAGSPLAVHMAKKA